MMLIMYRSTYTRRYLCVTLEMRQVKREHLVQWPQLIHAHAVGVVANDCDNY